MSRRSRILATVVLVGAQAVAVSSAEAAFPGKNGKIYFTEEFATGGKLFSLAANGRIAGIRGQSRFDASQGRVSSNGRHIVFQSYRNGNSELYRVRVNGTGLKRLTRTRDINEVLPTWSPNGRRIAFQAGLRDSPDQDIYKMRAGGKGVKRLTTEAGSDGAPAWSPDGRQIAFQTNRPSTDGFDVWVMNANGSGQRAVTRLPNNEGEPSWSPDGTRLAISSSVFVPAVGIQDDIFTVGLDGSGLVQITTDPALDFTPAWSPNGRRIAFVSNRAGNFDVHTMRADGTDVRRVTSAPLNETHIDWAPRKR